MFAALLMLSLRAYTLDVNVRNAPYNAAGDGTNDRLAIQKAIDDVSAAGGGTVPSGGRCASAPSASITCATSDAAIR